MQVASQTDKQEAPPNLRPKDQTQVKPVENTWRQIELKAKNAFQLPTGWKDWMSWSSHPKYGLETLLRRRLSYDWGFSHLGAATFGLM